LVFLRVVLQRKAGIDALSRASSGRGVLSAAHLRLIAVAVLAFVLGAWWGGGQRQRTAQDKRAASTTSTSAALPTGETSATRTLEDFTSANAANTGLRERLLATVRQRDYFRRKHDLYELGLSLDASGLRAAMDAAMTLSTMDRDWAHPALLSRWQEVDPEGCLAWVRDLPRGSHQDFMVREYFNVLALKDPVKGLPVVLAWKASPDNPHEGELYQFFEGWTRHDPIGAARAALTLPDKEDRDSALRQSLERWAQRDPLGALAFEAQAPDTDLRIAIYGSWAEENPQAALAHSLALPDGPERERGIRAVFNSIAQADRARISQLIEQVPAGPSRNAAIESAIGKLDYHQPRTAAELVLLLPGGKQNELAGSVANHLGREDSAAAIAWVERLAPEARRSALNQIVQGIIEREPQAALALIGKYSADVESHIIEPAVRTWAEKAPEAALDWAKALPAGAGREAALRSALGVLAATDPRRALALAGQYFTTPESVSSLGQVASVWAEKDPAGAASWAAQLLSEPARDMALSQAIHRWVAQDPGSVGEWLDQMPASPARDTATVAFIQAVADADPDAAAQWAATIANPEQQQRMLRRVLFPWHKADPVAAEEWLRYETGVPEALRQNLLRTFTQ